MSCPSLCTARVRWGHSGIAAMRPQWSSNDETHIRKLLNMATPGFFPGPPTSVHLLLQTTFHSLPPLDTRAPHASGYVFVHKRKLTATLVDVSYQEIFMPGLHFQLSCTICTRFGGYQTTTNARALTVHRAEMLKITLTRKSWTLQHTFSPSSSVLQKRHQSLVGQAARLS